STGRGFSSSIEQGINHSKLDPPMVIAVHSVAGFFNPVKTFQADTEPFAQLPDEVGAGIMAGVIKSGRLPGGVVEIHITVRDGGAKLLAPTMGEANHGTPISQGLEVPVGIEGRVTIQEARVVAHTAHPFAVNAEQLQRVA